MTWFQRLYETYENVLDNPLFADEENTLTPIGHTSQQVHIISLLYTSDAADD